jgi:hypothetical protein
MPEKPPTRIVPAGEPGADLTTASPPERRRSRWFRVGPARGSRLDVSRAGRSQTAGETSIPPELLADARERTRRMAAVLSIGAVVLTLGDLLAAAAGFLPLARAWVLPAASLGFLLLSLLLWLASRSESFGNLQVFRFGLAYVVVSAALAGFVHSVHEAHRFDQVTGFGPHAILLTCFPLLLPCPPRTTLKVCLGAGIAIFLGFWAAGFWRLAAPSPSSYADLTVVVIGSTAIAYTTARLVFRLQKDIVAARRLGSWSLEEKIGSGGMGEVWRGRHGMLASPAAIKLMHPAGPGKVLDASAAERFRREARVTAALRSPHTVHLYDFGTGDDGTFFFAMELLEGIDLAALVRRFGPQPPERVRGILLQACDSLAEAHALGLVHRDIKPENLMLCRQGRQVEVVKVLDFGVVGLLGESAAPGGSLAALASGPAEGEASDLTRPGTFLGTLAYAAPESFFGQGSDARSDLYSLGCVAFWLLTGRKVVEAAGSVHQLAVTWSKPVPRPSTLGVTVPEDLDAIVAACLAREPSSRPPSAEALAQRLEAGGPGWSRQQASAWWAQHLPAAARAAPAPAAPPQFHSTVISRRPAASGDGSV